MASDVSTNAAYITRYMNAWCRFYYKKKGGFNPEAWDEKEWESRRPEAHGALHEHIYSNLTILDGKVRVLMSSASIFTALTAILLERESVRNSEIAPLLAVSAIISLLSVLLVLWIVRVHWSTVQDFENQSLEQAVRNLILTRNRRTRWYRCAWRLHVLILLVSFGLLFLHILTLPGIGAAAAKLMPIPGP